ncbi:MAG: RT0821/Lpp0805 family surface protein [Alphaproteobacteria bacterium]|jgi:surface antigen
MFKKILVLSISTITLFSCATYDNQGNSKGGINKQQVGALSGAALGAVAGSNVGKGKGNIVAIAGGTVIGALLGSEVGKSLDNADRAYYSQTTQTSLETAPDGKASTWVNPNSGNSGDITPTRTFQDPKGSYCREFTQTISVGGKQEQAVGSACRDAQGTWRVQN